MEASIQSCPSSWAKIRWVVSLIRGIVIHGPEDADDSRYRVTGYGVKLVPGSDESRDTWRYTFHLEREKGQESMEKVLGIPMPDQLDDWEDYRAGPMYSPEEEGMEQLGEGVDERKRRYTIGEDTGGRLGSIDSGYFSSHPSALKGEVQSP